MASQTINSQRKLGQGYSLAINTGNGTHLTLVYFHRLKRGYEQDLVKRLATEFLEEKYPNPVTLTPNGYLDEQNQRSIKIIGEITTIQEKLQKIFLAMNLQVDVELPQSKIPHIDLRGQSPNIIPKEISLNPPEWWL